VPLQQAGKETKIQQQVGIVALRGRHFEGSNMQAYYLEEVRLACLAFDIDPPIELGTSRYNPALTKPQPNAQPVCLCNHSYNPKSRCDQLIMFEVCHHPGPAQRIDLKSVGCVGSNETLAFAYALYTPPYPDPTPHPTPHTHTQPTHLTLPVWQPDGQHTFSRLVAQVCHTSLWPSAG
jgi:hypothetical protein